MSALPPAAVHRVQGSAREVLGQGFAAVILDLHDGLDADVLGRCHGLVERGGALILLLPDDCPPQEALAAYPFGPADVSGHFWARLLARLPGPRAERPLAAVGRPSEGTAEQAAVVARLVELLRGGTPARVVLTADRGRGKSAALGLALRQLAPGTRVVVTAPDEAAAAEVFRFLRPERVAGSAGGSAFVAPQRLVREPIGADVIAVDEAAGLSVALLEAIVARHPRAHLVFATTVHGYEGTGRGFALRFVPSLDAVHLGLTRPIRWDPDDPLEAWAFDLLLLGARSEGGDPAPARDPAPPGGSPLVVRALDRAELAADEPLLREVFGLLVQAHYRTTPSDLHRLLDAPNLHLHAVLEEGHPVAVALLAREGGLAPEACADIVAGRGRIRGHALADTLVCHADRPEAGELAMVRSVRTVVRPDRRGRGLARLLVEAVHAAWAPDLFGTLFGATPELLRFRRALGYELVRVGASRGSRSGEPAAVMVRPVSAAARELVAALRADLARELPLQLELMGAESGPLEVELVRALFEGLPPPAPLEPEARLRRVGGYAWGARPYEAAAFALEALVRDRPALLERLDPTDRALVEGRVLRRVDWFRLAEARGWTVRATMRALRRAVGRMLAAPDPTRPATGPAAAAAFPGRSAGGQPGPPGLPARGPAPPGRRAG